MLVCVQVMVADDGESFLLSSGEGLGSCVRGVMPEVLVSSSPRVPRATLSIKRSSSCSVLSEKFKRVCCFYVV